MTYIRVVNDLGDEYLTTYEEYCEMVAELQDSGFDFEGCIIKKGDTIEELCDEFICVLKNGEHNRVMLSTAKEYAKGKMEIYGAIWTDKGLIYVAKMNEKGELILL